MRGVNKSLRISTGLWNECKPGELNFLKDTQCHSDEAGAMTNENIRKNYEVTIKPS